MNAIKHKSRTKTKRKFIFLFVIALLTALTAFSLRAIDNRIFPAAVEIASHNAKNLINKIVNNSVKTITENKQLSSADFYVRTLDETGALSSLSVNTILVNDVCANLSSELSSAIEEINTEELNIPIGALLGFDAFSNIGPNYPISVMPSGEAEVDYESSFKAEGINQVNFQIWLNIKVMIKIVNPIQHDLIVVTRKIPLVNTFIPGEVPTMFFDTKN